MKPIYVIYSIVGYGNENDLLLIGYVHDEDKAVSVIEDYLKNEFYHDVSESEEIELSRWGELLLEEEGVKLIFDVLDNLEEE